MGPLRHGAHRGDRGQVVERLRRGLGSAALGKRASSPALMTASRKDVGAVPAGAGSTSSSSGSVSSAARTLFRAGSFGKLKRGSGMASAKAKFQLDQPSAASVGTTGYRAPELYKNGQYDEKIDLFAIGVIT